MESSGLQSLRASTVLEILDRTFRIYRNNFLPFFLMVAAVQVPMALLTFALNSSVQDVNSRLNQNRFGTGTTTTFDSSDFTELIGASVLLLVVALVGAFIQNIVINSLITTMTSEEYLGRDISIGEAFDLSKGRMLPLFGGMLISGVIFLVLFLIFGVVGAICLFPLLAVPVIMYYALCLYYLIVPTLVLEDVDVMVGLRRALTFARVRFWQVFGLVFSIQLIATIIGIIIAVLGGLVSGSFEQNDPMFNLISSLAGLVVAPLLPIGLTLMYYDTRIRAEGLDMALQSVPTPQPRPADLPSPEPTMPLFTSQDLINILILVALLVGLIVVSALFAFSALSLLGFGA